MSEDPEIRQEKVDAEGHLAIDYIEKPSVTGATDLEKAIAVFMAASEYLKSKGIYPTAGKSDGDFLM